MRRRRGERPGFCIRVDSERLAMIGETPTATMSEREARECSRI
jgi:hypothetical protein